MSKIIPFKIIIPKEFQDNDYWDINDTIIVQTDDRFKFQKHSKYRWIDFSILDDENIKNEAKSFLWDALGRGCLEMTVENFKEKFLPTFISLLKTFKDIRIKNSLLNIEFRHFKDELTSNTREPHIFRKMQLFLLKSKPFEKENDVWDVFHTPMNKNDRLRDFETSEARIVNFSLLKSEPLKHELKNYLYSYVTKDFKEFDAQTSVNNHLLPFQSILRCLKDENEASILNIKTESLKTRFEQDGKTDINYYLLVFERIKSFLVGKEHLDFFERDLWNLEELNISDERINKTKLSKTLSFVEFEHEENKFLLKRYIKYLLLNSQLSLSTVVAKSNNLKKFLLSANPLSLKELTLSDRGHVISIIQSNSQQEQTLVNLNKFLLYLSREKFIDHEIGKNFISKEDIKPRATKFQERFVDERTIKEIFQKVEESEVNYEYLEPILYILTFCGLRISEICNLKLNCVYTGKNNVKRLRFESIKMRKEVDIPIIEKVYEKIRIQQRKAKEKLGENKDFLFPSNGTSQSKKTKNKPISTKYVSDIFKKFCDENEISNKNNENYIFKAHDYRHTFATHLAQNNVSIEVIKELLAHETPQMTLAYLDKKQEREKKNIERELKEKGKYDATSSIIEGNKISPLESDENVEAIYLKKNLNYQTLPNGTCTLPINKNCPHPNACLTCKSFITTSDYLDSFKEQLERTNKMIEFSEQRGFEQQVTTNKETKKQLTYFIEELENGKEFVKPKDELPRTHR